MSKLKDKTHSEYVHQLMAYKKRITEIQQWIKTEKELISMCMKLDKGNSEVEHKRLKMLKEENRFLSEANKELRKTIKGHQKILSNFTYKDNPIHQRMYSMVLRQLTPMQKGIQSLHSVVEYGEMMKQYNVSEVAKKAYEVWANRDKTMIVLDAGTSTDLADVISKLKEIGIPHAVSHEPDLYDCITSVCFIADERVWDVKNYPSYEDYIEMFLKMYNTFTTEEYWAENVFNCTDPTNFLKLRELIFSKKLSM